MSDFMINYECGCGISFNFDNRKFDMVRVCLSHKLFIERFIEAQNKIDEFIKLGSLGGTSSAYLS